MSAKIKGEQGGYDIFTAQVLELRLKNIVEEMATTLLRTSGSPVLTEAKDFSTAIFDRNGEHVAFSGYVTWHLGSSLVGVEATMREYPEEELHPGDHFVVNDPHTGGAIHEGDVGIISPLFYQDKLVGWAFSNAHVLDVGGMSPGGWAPVAFDCYSEALRFPPTRIVEQGKFVRELQRLLMTNVRLPIPVMNDIKSLVAANMCAQRRLTELLDKYGLETYNRYAEINKGLAEDLIRKRIQLVPDGSYRAVEWVEYDGHGEDRLHKVNLEVTVQGDEITFDFTGSDPQVDGFVNAGRGAMLGGVYAEFCQEFAFDIPINAGVFRPVKVNLGPPGTLTNPTIPAPVSCGHMETVGKAEKAISQALTKAMQFSTDFLIRGRVAGQSHNCWPGNAWIGVDQYGSYNAFAMMDCGSAGLGAQSTGDGLDIGSYEIQQDNGIPDVEINEGLYPILYLWRRLNVDSGGAGAYRGGLGIDMSWIPYQTDNLLGTIETACSEVPASGELGGLPGGTSIFLVSRAYDALGFAAREARLPAPNDLESRFELLPNHFSGLSLAKTDVWRQITGGGGGLGDPLLRDPKLVEKDIRDGYISPAMARNAYGVLWDESAERVDVTGSESRRLELRSVRIGGVPKPTAIAGFTHPVTIKTVGRKEVFACAYCGTELGPADGLFKDHTAAQTYTLVSRLAEYGTRVRDRKDPGVSLVEHYCPGCGVMLVVDVRPGAEAVADIHLGNSGDVRKAG